MFQSEQMLIVEILSHHRGSPDY